MNSNKNWGIKIDEAVYKELNRFPQKDRDRIISVIDGPIFSPYSGDIEKIKGEQNMWRRRIGSYRIFYEIQKKKRFVHIFRVERRTSNAY